MRPKTNLPHIEFASQRRWSHWWATSRTSVLLAAGLSVICVIALQEWRDLDQTRQQAQDHLRLLALTNTTATAPRTDRNQPTAKEIEGVNRVVAELNIPWFSLLSALEHNKPRDIAVLSVEPAADKPIMLLLAETNDPQTMLAYVDTLKNNPRFISAELTKHETIVQNPYKPIRFTVQLDWSAKQ